MCGIAGIVAPDGGPVASDAVGAMLARLVHRGPDSSGLFEAPGVSAGIRRLRVVDLETGDQPIANEDGTVEVVFNGEIYNHDELRAALRDRGHAFATASDTEVLVHLWEDEGTAMLDRLNGMFAFCLADRRRREVLIARDRAGIKPLYWARDGSRIVFASENPALEAGLTLRPDLDPARLLDLFFLQYVPGDATIRTGVRALPPGHLLHLREGVVAVRRWYQPPAEGPRAGGDDDDEARALRGILADAVRRQRVADVPVGVFLSGGLDSTIVAALVADQGAGLETFSVGFDEARFDERGFARVVADRLGARHHEITLRAGDVGAKLPDLVRTLGEPVTDPALIPTWLLARFARERVTVALSGEGADELFGGYRRHAWQERFGWARRVPALAAAGRAGGRAGWLPGRSAQAVEALGTADPALRYVRWAATTSLSRASDLFEAEALAAWERETAGRFELYFSGPSDHGLGARLRADLGEWLPNNLLAKVDRATMAVSLEARVPFLDHRVVERAVTMPDRLKIAHGATKVVLRRAFRDLVPEAVLSRPKRGFDLPLDAWMRGPLRELARERFASGVLGRWPLLRPGSAENLLNRHAKGGHGLGLPLFLLLSLAEFLDARG